MANYYYVKHDGTATGDGGRIATTPSTGTFATKGIAACYDSIQSAVGATTPPVSGDFIYCSSSHDFTYTDHAYANVVSGVSVVSVDDANLDQYLEGATESTSPYDTTSTNDFNASCSTVGGVALYDGISFLYGDDFRVASTGTLNLYKNVTFKSNYSTATLAIDTLSDGNSMECIDCTFDFANSSHQWRIDQGNYLLIENCVNVGTTVSELLLSAFNDGGANIEINNTDLSTFITATTGYFTESAGNTTADQFRAKLYRCKLPAWAGFFGTIPTGNFNYSVDIIACTNPTTPDSDAYYYFESYRPSGIVLCDTTTYLSATYDGTNGFSADLSSSANASIGNPLRHKLLSIPAQDLTSIKNYKVNILNDGLTLTDTDFWIEAVHNDNTDLALGVTVSTRNSDILATGTNLTTNTEAWTETLGTPVKQEVTVTIPALTNVDNGVVDIYVNLTLASTTVWVCPEYVVT